MNKQTLYFNITDPDKDKDMIRRAARLLAQGELVAFPTETVYGLGGNALDPTAVQGIFAAKGRPMDNPMIVHITKVEELPLVCAAVPPPAWSLAARFWPGPLTLVLPAGSRIPPVVTGGLDTVAVRVPDHPVALALLREAGVPVAAPSANLSGRPSPTQASHVLEDLEGRIAAVLDGGPCRVGVESTVLDLTGPQPRILRPGSITLEDLLEVLPVVLPPAQGPVSAGETPPSPGMKYRHYAPRGTLFLLEGDKVAVRQELLKALSRYQEEGQKVGLLTASSWLPPGECFTVNLAGRDDPAAAATRLFAALRKMDEEGIDIILAEGIPEEGIGMAVMNRLRKAAGKNILTCDEKNISREICRKHPPLFRIK